MSDAGWLVRQDAIWHKTTAAPENVRNRFYRNHEYLFMFAKQADHYFDLRAAREQAASTSAKGKVVRFRRQTRFKGIAAAFPKQGIIADGMRNRRSVWPIPNERHTSDHPCPFPKALIEPMLLSSCPEGGVCLDPFAGTGTTGFVALAHGRKAILIEANEKYCATAKHRIETELEAYKSQLEERRKQESTATLLNPPSEIEVGKLSLD